MNKIKKKRGGNKKTDKKVRKENLWGEAEFIALDVSFGGHPQASKHPV